VQPRDCGGTAVARGARRGRSKALDPVQEKVCGEGAVPEAGGDRNGGGESCDGFGTGGGQRVRPRESRRCIGKRGPWPLENGWLTPLKERLSSRSCSGA